METASAQKNVLASKLARILGEIGKVPKSGHNSFHNYDYVTENDLVYAVRSKLAESGVFVFTSTESQNVEVCEDKEGKKFFLTTVTTAHTFVDGESGEQFTVKSQGQGSDNGDKGGYKAMTGAMKYFLYKCFMIPTGDDPEQDTRTDERGAPETKGAATRQSAPRTQAQRAPASESSLDHGGHIQRETSNVEERAQFEGGKWEKVKIHFGANYKGMTLGELSKPQMKGWQNWQPKPYNGRIADEDRKLRTALDVAAVEGAE